MAHSHTHSHSHNHDMYTNFNRKFKIGIILNLSFIIIELIYGILYNSLALVADAGHNFSDVIGLVIAWGANYLVTKSPTKNFTYGYKKSSIMAAMLNALLLVVALGIIIWEAIGRLSNPNPVQGNIIIIVALIGVVINGITTYLFLHDKDKDLNIKGAYLHMLADTMISLGVAISGVIILYTGWFLIDPIISIVIAVVIFWGTWGLLKDSTILSLDGVPSEIDINEIKKYFDESSKIQAIHDLHVWALSTSENALTVHLIPKDVSQADILIKEIQHDLEHHFKITHSTIQIEKENCEVGC